MYAAYSFTVFLVLQYNVDIYTVCLIILSNLGWVGLGHAGEKNDGLGWVGSICCWAGLGWVKKYGPMSISAVEVYHTTSNTNKKLSYCTDSVRCGRCETAIQGHSRSSVVVPIDAGYMTSL